MQLVKFLNPLKYFKYAKRLLLLPREISLLRLEVDYLNQAISNERFQALKNKYQGQRCVIIGNGPSLNIEDLEKLKNEYTFASNKIFLCFDETEWRPTFYSVEDTLVLKQNADLIKNVEADYKLFPDFTLSSLKYDRENIAFKFSHKNPFPKLPYFYNDTEEIFYWGSTIVYTQIQLAFYMGFSEIYLIGVDYTYNVPSKKKGKNVLVSEGEVNHFHKDYRKPGEKWHIPNLEYHEKSFERVNKEVEQRNIKVFNATRGGKLEAFPRKEFDEVFKG